MVDFLPTLFDKPVWMRIFTLLLLIAVSLLLSAVIGIIIGIPIFGFEIITQLSELNDFNNSETISILKYFQVINQIGVFVLPAIAFAYLETRKPSDYLKANQKPSFVFLFFAILLIIASIPATNWMVVINESMKLPEFLKSIEDWMRDSERNANQLTEAFLNVNTVGGLIVNIFIIALVAAVGEELLFRGIILRLLIEWTKNIHWGVILSSILFSALHMQFFGFLPRMTLGILFGYIFIWSGTIWIPIILHFLFNGLTVVGAYLYNTGKIQTDVESLGSTNNVLIILLSFLFTLAILYTLYRIRKKPKNTEVLLEIE